MAQKRRSYAWAFHTEVGNVPIDALSVNAQEGLRCARELADDARERSTRALQHQTPTRLTIASIAAEEGFPASSARRWIKQARDELFGQISDSAIYKRKQRQHEKPEARPCQQPNCDQQLPPNTHANRRYCNHHRTPAQRTRRHRQTTRYGVSGGLPP
jgi:hypothetical protein